MYNLCIALMLVGVGCQVNSQAPKSPCEDTEPAVLCGAYKSRRMCGNSKSQQICLKTCGYCVEPARRTSLLAMTFLPGTKKLPTITTSSATIPPTTTTPTTTTTAATTALITTTPTTTAPETKTTTPPATKAPCDEKIPDSPTCDQYPDACTLPVKIKMCQRHCGLCYSQGLSITVTTAKCEDTEPATLCGAYKSRGMCGNSKAQQICLKTCGYCVEPARRTSLLAMTFPPGTKKLPTITTSSATIPPTTTTPTTTTTAATTALITTTPTTTAPETKKTTPPATKAPCDEKIPDSPTCDYYPDACTLPERIKMCQRHCGLCSSSSQSTPGTIVVPVTVSSAGCVDTEPATLCEAYKSKGMCGNSRAQNLCCKTCNVLFESLPSTTTTTRDATTQTAAPATDEVSSAPSSATDTTTSIKPTMTTTQSRTSTKPPPHTTRDGSASIKSSLLRPTGKVNKVAAYSLQFQMIASDYEADEPFDEINSAVAKLLKSLYLVSKGLDAADGKAKRDDESRQGSLSLL